ncbi:MAG: hypothetical protein AAGH15_26270, partial [Myxococcota bacterium]
SKRSASFASSPSPSVVTKTWPPSSSSPCTMARLVEQELKKPIAKAIVHGELDEGGQVFVTTEGEGDEAKLALRFEAAVQA